MDYSLSSSFIEDMDLQLQDTNRSATSSLHSVRKPPTKPWRKPMATRAAQPTKVYKVVPSDFRRMVQKLTGAPEFQSPHVQIAAPQPQPQPSNMAMSQAISNYNVSEPVLQSLVGSSTTHELSIQSPATTSFEMSLPSSWYPWSPLPLMSPRSQLLL